MSKIVFNNNKNDIFPLTPFFPTLIQHHILFYLYLYFYLYN